MVGECAGMCGGDLMAARIVAALLWSLASCLACCVDGWLGVLAGDPWIKDLFGGETKNYYKTTQFSQLSIFSESSETSESSGFIITCHYSSIFFVTSSLVGTWNNLLA